MAEHHPSSYSEADPQRPSEAELAAAREAVAAEQDEALRRLNELRARAEGTHDELTALGETEENYRLLAGACETLEHLVERGAANLFWGPETGSDAARAHLEQARERIEGFERQVEDLRARHRAALEDVEQQFGMVDVLAYELDQARQEEESRKSEWVVERRETTLPARLMAMPWMRGFDDDQRFRRALAGSMAAALLLGLIIPLIDIPIADQDEPVQVPERFAKFIREEQQPPVAVREPQPEPEEPDTKSEPEEPEEVEKAPETQVAASEPEAETTEEKVRSKGILAFRENFSSLSAGRPEARLGAQASLSNDGSTEVGLPQRNMVAAQGSDSSGGINLASISRDVGGGGAELSEGVELARVASAIDGGGSGDRPRASSATSGRTDEEIQIVFDRYKAALYRLYNRALRKDPTLQGQIVLRLTIEPDGSVSLCAVQESNMGAPELADQVVTSVSTFQFGAKDVPPVTILYPIDFLPTA